jgi:RimJ/RimL family protein N-acetyltransferase
VDASPLHDLRLWTPRLELRLGTRSELVQLARLAEQGVHPPEEMPFAIAWTDRIGEPDFEESFLAFHEGHLAEWLSENWALGLLVWKGSTLVGTQELFGQGFAEHGLVGTGSWVGEAYQRHGIGTEMRAAVLELAFRGLGAREAESGWLDGNDASRRVSEKLGYAEVDERTQSPRGEPVREHVMRISSDAWRSPVVVEIAGLEPCLPLFGVSGGPSTPS